MTHTDPTTELSSEGSIHSNNREVTVNHLVCAERMMFLGLRLLRYTWRRLETATMRTNYDRFKSQFGISPATAAWVYEDLQLTGIDEAKIEGNENDLKSFLMALHYLRKYPTEEDMVARFDYCAYWAREKVWGAIKKIRALKAQKIVWNRDHFRDEKWNMTFGGIHCSIIEPTHPVWSQDRRYYSHKYNKAGLDYELGICLSTNQLLWMNGPHPAGTNDIKIFKTCGLMREFRNRNQKAIGDKGYNGAPEYCSTPNAHDNEGAKLFKSRYDIPSFVLLILFTSTETRQ